MVERKSLLETNDLSAQWPLIFFVVFSGIPVGERQAAMTTFARPSMHILNTFDCFPPPPPAKTKNTTLGLANESEKTSLQLVGCSIASGL